MPADVSESSPNSHSNGRPRDSADHRYNRSLYVKNSGSDYIPIGIIRLLMNIWAKVRSLMGLLHVFSILRDLRIKKTAQLRRLFDFTIIFDGV